MTETNATNPQQKTFSKSLTVLKEFFKAVKNRDNISDTKRDETAKCLEQMGRIHYEMVDYYNIYAEEGGICEKDAITKIFR